jgi:hypothetical protein
MTVPKTNEDFMALKRALQKFQSERINATYADIKSMEEYAPIGKFFFEKLYAPQDFSFRDTSITQLHKLLKGKVYSGMVSAVSKVIALHEATESQDDRMVAQMMAMGVGVDMDMAQYKAVYRSLDNYDERIAQIELGTEVTRAFHRLSKKWVVAVSLNTVRTAAHMIGMGKILDFIHEGYTGFRAIKNIDFFVETMEHRERAWHDEIWTTARIDGVPGRDA